jgi:hypothetical protein
MGAGIMDPGAFTPSYLARTTSENGIAVNVGYEIGDPRRYGALCNGAFDDTAAYNTALAVLSLMGSGTLMVPIGTSLITATLAIPTGIVVEGESQLGSKISYTGAAIALDVTYGALVYNAVAFRKFQLKSTTGTIGIRVSSAIGVYIDQVYIRGSLLGWTVAGIQLSAPSAGQAVISFSMQNSYLENCNGYGVQMTGVNAAVNHVNFFNNRFNSNLQGHVTCSNDVRVWNFIGNDLEAAGAAGALYLRNVLGLTIQGNYFEQGAGITTVTLSAAQGCKGVTITGNHFEGQLGTGTAVLFGDGAPVYGLDCSANWLSGYATGIGGTGAGITVVNGVIGPNRNECATPIGTINPASTNLHILDPYTGTTTVAMTCGTSGTITLFGPTTNFVSWKRRGELVTLYGYLTVSGVAAPVGTLTVTGLPFAATGHVSVAVWANGLQAGATAPLQGRIDSGATDITIDTMNAGAAGPAAALVKGSSEFRFAVTYPVA